MGKKIMLLLFGISCILQLNVPVNAGNQNFEENPDRTIPVAVNFINGDFEEPNLEKTIPPLSYNATVGTSPTLDAFWTMPSANGWLYIPDTEVPGWNTKPVDPADNSNPFANMIEYHRTGVSNSPSGNQSIDMLGAMNQEFYQIVETTPGNRVYYSYQARGAGLIVHFICSEENDPDPQPERIDTMAASWDTYSGYVDVTGSRTYFGYRCINGPKRYGSATYNGVYYENIKTSGGGPGLDNIKFQTQSKLIIEESVLHEEPEGVLPGEIITYQVKITNHGQSDTKDSILTDILGDDVAYAGNVRINSTDAGSLAQFDSGTDMLTVYFGDDAANGTGGSLKGTVSTGSAVGDTVIITFDVKVTGAIGDTIRNQAAVTYDDKGFEKDDDIGYEDYSNITAVKIINQNRYSLDLTKELAAASGQPEHFVFKIDQYELDQTTWVKTFYAEITIPTFGGAETIQLSSLSAGYYQITELNSSWHYQIADDSSTVQTVTVADPYTDPHCIFKNKQIGDSWVSGQLSIKNKMKPIS